MKLIAHRGNTNGPDPLSENSLQYIDNAIELGFDVEIDLRYDDITKTLWLGHDEPKYQVSFSWLEKRFENLWIHCKNIESLFEFSYSMSEFNYFWHQNDDFTLTSKNYIWTYPGKSYTQRSVIVMPEWNELNWDILKLIDCYGICTDYPKKLK